jgi:hypothetical protein
MHGFEDIGQRIHIPASSGRSDKKLRLSSSSSPQGWTSTPQYSMNAGAEKAQIQAHN